MVTNISSVMKVNKLESQLCQNLKQKDYLDHGYMAGEQLGLAINETMAKIPPRSG